MRFLVLDCSVWAQNVLLYPVILGGVRLIEVKAKLPTGGGTWPFTENQYLL